MFPVGVAKHFLRNLGRVGLTRRQPAASIEARLIARADADHECRRVVGEHAFRY